MMKIKDYTSPIWLYMIGYFAIILSLLLGKDKYFIYSFFLIIVGSLSSSLCILYYFYKKHILDRFITVTIVISGIVECSYGIVALIFFSWLLYNNSSIFILFFIYILFYLFTFSCLPAIIAIDGHIHKRAIKKYFHLFYMVFAPILVILLLFGFFLQMRDFPTTNFLIILISIIPLYSFLTSIDIKISKGLNYDN